MQQDAELDRRQATLDWFQEQQRRALRDLQSARARKVSHRRAYENHRRSKRDTERARRHLEALRSILALKEVIPNLLAGVPAIYGYDVKIRSGRGRRFNIYYGGLDKPDGFGHGHLVVDHSGNIVYNRLPWVSPRVALAYR